MSVLCKIPFIHLDLNNAQQFWQCSKTSQDGHPSGNAKLSVLQRWPSYGNTQFMSQHVWRGFRSVKMDTNTLNKEEGVFEVFLSQNCYETFWNKYLSHLVKLVLSLLAVMRGKFTLHFSFGEWKSGRLIEVAVLGWPSYGNFLLRIP